MTQLKSKYPAISFMVSGIDMPPYGCSECQFAVEQFDPLTGEGANPSDPDEGYYNCLLLGDETVKARNGPKSSLGSQVWGEDPSCTKQDWQQKAREELLELTDGKWDNDGTQ